MRRIAVFSFLMLGVIHYCMGQSIEGVVLDKNEIAVAFATLLLDADPTRGIIADIDGKFRIDDQRSFDFIQITAIGFEDKKVFLNAEKGKSFLKIQLEAKAYDLTAAVVVAGENPAHKIIRKAVAKKKENNPEKLAAYSCRVYNKSTGDFYKPPLKSKKNPNKPKGRIGTAMDSLFEARASHLLSVNSDKHIFLMESVVDRKFKAPQHLLEEILHNRISGLKSPTFSAVIHSLQPFAFYDNYVQVLDKKFLNPLSPNSESQYYFNLIDTLFQGPDSIFVITFTPRKGKIFDGLSGVLNIHTDNYGLQLLKAKPANPGAMKLTLEQLYDRIDGYWFPIQLNIAIEADKYPSAYLGTKFSGRSYIDSIKINPPFRLKDFPQDGLKQAKGNENRSESLWRSIRTIPLSSREQKTYDWLDSLGAKKNIDKKLKIFNALVQGYYKMGPVNWNIFESIKSNAVEGFRPGIQLNTNNDLWENFKLGAYVGYGIRDGRWKYKGEVDWQLIPRREGRLKVFYNNGVREPARYELDQPGELITSRVYTGRLDLLENYGSAFSMYFLPYTHGTLSLEKLFFQPAYFYAFNPGLKEILTTFDITEIGFALRYAFAEKFTEMFGTRFRTEGNYPNLLVNIKKGISAFSGAHEYLQINSVIEGTFRLGRLGWSTFAINSGMALGEAPLPKLFSSTGLGNEFGFLIDDFGFRTMQPYEFLSDRYAFLFFKQELGALLQRHKFFRPTFSLEQNIGWGNLRNAAQHVGQPFQTMDQGFYETGLVIDNVLCLNYFSLAYIGLGVGGWYRYGPLQRAAKMENWGVKVTLNFELL